MTRQVWRIAPIGRSLAWVYVRPHEVDWAVPAAEAAARRYTITEGRQRLVDDKRAGCIRYLMVPATL